MTTENSPLKEFSENPDQIGLNELITNIENLEEGETLTVSHSFVISKFGGEVIAIDPAIAGKDGGENGILPPTIPEAMSFKAKNTKEYTHSSITVEDNAVADGKTKIGHIGFELGKYIDKVLISHIDPDHVGMELILGMTEGGRNEGEDPKVYGPEGFVSKIMKYNKDSEIDITDRFHDLKSTNSEGFFNLPSLDGKSSVTAISIPHLGSPEARNVQGFVFQNTEKRSLYIPDAALSPEVIDLILGLGEGEPPLKDIFVSTGTYVPSTFWSQMSEEKSRWFRDLFEEPLSHSVLLPLICELLAPNANTRIVHQGVYFHNFENDVSNRIPTDLSKLPDFEVDKWKKNFTDTLAYIIEKQRTGESHPLTYPSHYTAWVGFAGRMLKQISFASEITKWLRANPAPKQIVDEITFAQANTIVK